MLDCQKNTNVITPPYKSSNNETGNLSDKIKEEIKKIRSYTPKVAIFGDSGVGKSSLCNIIFGKDIAKMSDVEACTREVQEIFIGDENSGFILMDVPGVGEDIKRHQEYSELYESLLPDLDLIIWAIKADDRKFASAEDIYKNIIKPNIEHCPVVFVVTQIDKIEPIEEWYENGGVLGNHQRENLEKKIIDISKRFDIETNLIIPVSTKNKGYNIDKLIEKIVDILPDEKKYSFVRETNTDHTTETAYIIAEKGILNSIYKMFGTAYSNTKEFLSDIADSMKGTIKEQTTKVATEVVEIAVTAAFTWLANKLKQK